MVTIDDFMIKNKRGSIDFKTIYLDKIKKGEKRILRLLENENSDMIKKFVFIHSYLAGVGSTPCTNTQENIKQKKYCLFCNDLVEQLNNVDKEHFDWLKTLDIVNQPETDKFNTEIASKSKDVKPKLIFNDGFVVEIGKTFDKEVSRRLDKKHSEVYNSFYIKRQKTEGKIRKCKFYAPVYDYATGEVKIYEFSASIWNQLQNSFTKAGYDFTSADFLITHTAQKGNWWTISKKDSSNISDEISAKYALIKDDIKKALDMRTNIPTPEQQVEIFNKYKTKLAEKESGVVNTDGASQQSSNDDDFENLF